MVAYSSSARGDLLLRLLLSALLCGGAALAFLARRCTPVVDWLVRWPHAAGSLLGLAWWLFLTPSIVGLLIMLVCAVAAVRPR